METLPILLDTDIGTDIDDAVALAYLLSQPRCELLGITTVTGEADKRASLADAICRAAGRDDIPIHVGIEQPLLIAPKQPHAEQAEALADEIEKRVFTTRNPSAIGFLREAIRSRPGEITLLTIGPLTNIALLFAGDPEIPTLLKELIIMGGQYYGRNAWHGNTEWNIACDPHAAAMVLAASVPRIVAVGLDVTTQCILPADECRTRFSKAGGALGVVASLAEVWFKHASHITFHDPLAAALVFEPTLCVTEPHQIAVELVSPLTMGQTIIKPKTEKKPHEIAKTVNSPDFFKHYFEVVGG